MGKEILTERQIAFLEVVRHAPDITKHFYLTGGTALAAFYLNHRESEDLDFFSEEEIDPLAIEVFLKSRKTSLGFKQFEYQRSFNRSLFFLHFPDGVLKTEFTYFPFPTITSGEQEGLLRIDSLRDIAVNKIFTISQQTRARDFIDLYFILQREKWQLAEILKDARIKFDTHIDLIQLGAQLLKIRTAKDTPRMRVPLDENALQSFFLEQAAALKKDIFE